MKIKQDRTKHSKANPDLKITPRNKYRQAVKQLEIIEINHISPSIYAWSNRHNLYKRLKEYGWRYYRWYGIAYYTDIPW